MIILRRGDARAGRPTTPRVGVVVLAMVTVVLSATGCGGSDGQSEEELVAETVNEFRSAVEADDGKAACGLLSPQGQKLMLRIAQRLGEGEAQNARTCSDAVSAQAEAIAHDRYAPEEATAGDVLLRLAENAAEVRCEPRGAVMVERIDDNWKVRVPACVD